MEGSKNDGEGSNEREVNSLGLIRASIWTPAIKTGGLLIFITIVVRIFCAGFF